MQCDIGFISLLNTKTLKESDSNLKGLLDVGLAAAIGFLLASEIVKMLHLYYGKGMSKSQRVIRALLSPFQLIPIMIHHKERKLELQMRRICTNAEQTNFNQETLTNIRNELNSIQRLKGEHRSTENVLEHFVQFILSVAVLVANKSGSEELKIVFLSNSQFRFSIISSIISLLSMVRGQINLISSQKNGQMGLPATCLLAVYMIVSLFIRAGIIFLSISATYQLIKYGKFQYGHLLFIFTITSVALLHIILSFAIQYCLLKGAKSNLKQALWSFLSPPLFLDWDFLYRQEEFEMSILDCWRRTRNSFLIHNLLTLVGNLALGIPVYILAYYKFQNPHFFETDDFFQFPIYSTLCTTIPALVSQLLLIGMGFLYFKKFHPWARILNAELAIRTALFYTGRDKLEDKEFFTHDRHCGSGKQ